MSNWDEKTITKIRARMQLNLNVLDTYIENEVAFYQTCFTKTQLRKLKLIQKHIRTL